MAESNENKTNEIIVREYTTRERKRQGPMVAEWIEMQVRKEYGMNRSNYSR